MLEPIMLTINPDEISSNEDENEDDGNTFIFVG